MPRSHACHAWLLTWQLDVTQKKLHCGRHTGAEKERSGSDWDSVIYKDLPGMDLKGKKVAFFGCGDSQSYGDYFCDAVGELHDQFSATGATLIGASCHISLF